MNQELEYWANEYRQWLKSGLRQIDYCSQKGHRLSDFKEQTRNARRKGIVDGTYPQKPIEKRNTFVAVDIMETETTPYCRIEFKGKSSVSFSDKTSLSCLKELVTTLMAN
jgi:hypothetical protein